MKGSVVRFEVRIRERIADQVEKGGEGKGEIWRVTGGRWEERKKVMGVVRRCYGLWDALFFLLHAATS